MKCMIRTNPKTFNVCVICLVFSFLDKMGTRVYLGRLPYHVREDDVERFVKGYGKTRDIMLKNGYGFVVSIAMPKFAFLLDKSKTLLYKTPEVVCQLFFSNMN